MNRKDQFKNVARRLQRVCQDETGVKPKYMLCLNIAHGAQNLGMAVSGIPAEERATTPFLTFKDRLVESGQARGEDK